MKPKQVKPTVFEGLPADTAQAAPLSSPARPQVPVSSPVQQDQTPAFRPVRRPPMAILEILDDGQESGEIIRLRNNSISIGREEGDVIIGHDDQISRKHAEIVREVVNGEYHWILKDLRSTNGTFFRVQKTRLAAGTSFLLGCREYVFRPAAGSSPAVPARPAAATVLSSDAATDANWQRLQTCLVRILPDKSEVAFPFQPDPKQPILIGSDPSQCRVAIKDDPTISPVHAAIENREDGLLLIDRKSRNGVWSRIRERKLPETAQFQIGEQRFRFRVC